LASKIATARFAATVAVLKSAGCDVSTLLGVAARSAGNAAIEAALARAAVRVEAGHSMSHALEREPLIDPLLVQLVGVGESTGRLDVALDGLAEHYDRDVPRSVKRTLALVEPALLLAAGAVVAFILLAAMLPIFDMYDHLG
jgi:type IV pilus assembly protein PilC